MSTNSAALLAVPLISFIVCIRASGAATPQIVGPGCTTAFYIDKDCSGYGVGVKSSGDYALSPGPSVGTPAWYTTGDKPDADDEDPAVNTTAQWQAKWGADNAAMVRFLRTRKKFSNTSRIFYLSQAGNDWTAHVNDPRRPFRSMAPILTALEDMRGGAVIVRGGIWTDLNFNPCPYSGGNPCFNMSGSEGYPLYVMAYPGERVQTNKGITSFTYKPFPHVCCVTIDGLEFRADRYGLGDAFAGTDTKSWALINCEFAGWHQIIFADHTRDALIKDSVFHDMMFHAIYFGFSGHLSPGSGDFDFALDEKRYQSGHSLGASYGGRIIGNVMYNNGAGGYEPIHINTYIDHPVVDGNIVSYSGGTAFALETGVYHAVIRNNLFFDNGRDCGTLYLYDHGDATIPATLRWNTIENNICYVGSPQDDIRGTTPGGGIAQRDNTESPGHYIKDTVIRNNIIVTNNRASGGEQVPFEFGRNSYPETDTIRGNIIWSSASGAGPDDRVMSISADADPAGAGGARSYDFRGFQTLHGNFVGNTYTDPQFKNASPTLVLTPGAFNFDVPSTSPAVRRGSGADKVETIGPYRTTPSPVSADSAK